MLSIPHSKMIQARLPDGTTGGGKHNPNDETPAMREKRLKKEREAIAERDKQNLIRANTLAGIAALEEKLGKIKAKKTLSDMASAQNKRRAQRGIGGGQGTSTIARLGALAQGTSLKKKSLIGR